jgi:uridine phosphorylase
MLHRFEEKHERSSLEYRKQFGRLPTAPPPKTVIFCYQGRFLKSVLSRMPHQSCDGCFSKLHFLTDCPGVAIGDFGIGAPAIASKMEELIAWGVEQFISIGTAGTLQIKAGIGDIVLCEKAVRDEGTSSHYLPLAKYIHAPRRMTNKLLQELKKAELSHHIGSTWTTDGFYRQTKEEVQRYQKEGVITVEMEAAALFAVAHFYQVDLGALFTISDSHADLIWQPHLEEEKVNHGLNILLDIALNAAMT